MGHGDPQRFSALRRAIPPAEAMDDSPTATVQSAAAQQGRQVITPELYVRCYKLCRAAIHAVPGHADDQVLIGAVAPWNDQTRYSGNPSGDWVRYFSDILAGLGPAGCDGITIHTYTHGTDPALIRSSARLDPPFEKYHYHFRAYRDFMRAIPANMRHLPVYITETDQDAAWEDRNRGWVKQAYGEIDAWNQSAGNQQIRALILYRWPRKDRWYIAGKQGVINDFREALRFDYRWQIVLPPKADFVKGQRLLTTDIVNLRRSPGYLNKPINDVITAVPAGAELNLLSGSSRTDDGLIWWRVAYEGNSQRREGWLAQFSPTAIPLLRTKESTTTPTPTMQIGFNARTLDIVRMRRTAGYQGKGAGDVITDVPEGTVLAIIGGPQQRDGLAWFKLRGKDNNSRRIEGWMAEAVNGVQLLEPTGERSQPASQGGTIDSELEAQELFAAGDFAHTLDIVKLRKSPGFRNKPAADVQAELALGVVLEIVGGPKARDGLLWWQVDVADQAGSALRGWIAESAPGDIPLLAKQEPDVSTKYKVGDHVRTLNIVRIRRSAGFAGKPESDVLFELPLGTVALIIGGPQRADGLTWWQSETKGLTRVKGWIADTDPTGASLLQQTTAPVSPPVGEDRGFEIGELVRAADHLRVRRSPGYLGKGNDDTVGDFVADTTLNIIEGPQRKDNLDWWRVGGISLSVREIVGWVAQKSPNGIVLVARPEKLPGTVIPDHAGASYLHAPFRGGFGIAQLWGENPDTYGRFTYDGVPLRGHNGIDFLTPVHTDLLAVDEAVVSEAVRNDPTGFGNYIILRHSWGESLYAHMMDLGVRRGQRVDRGQRIGWSGNTGFSQGPHLHFAIRIDPYVRTDGWGGYSDPLPYMNPADVRLPPYVLPQFSRAFSPLPAAAPAEMMQSRQTGVGLAPDQPGIRRP